MTIGVSVPGTVPNVDSHTDFSFMNVVAVALYSSVPVVVFTAISDPQHCVNGHWTVALDSIESNEPSLTAAAAMSYIDVALENHVKSCIIPGLCKLAILQ